MNPEERFDRELDGIRKEEPEGTAVQAAAGRVWRRIREELPEASAAGVSLRSCADFQALLPGYREGRLSEARRSLVQDHTRECVACRKALFATPAPALPRRAARTWWNPRWAAAAAVIAGLGLGVLAVYRPGAGRVMVETAGGKVFRVSGGVIAPVAAGAELTGDGELRTARDTGALVRLRDGSRVEMRERTAFTISESGPDTTLHLARGAILVEAARRRFGRLYVATKDCRVAVTGTVFSVSSGVKGSRVTVIEGEVRVAQGSAEAVLRAGGQYATAPSMAPVAIPDEIAWSRNLDKHLALLREFKELEKKLEAVAPPGLRYSSRLLGRLPSGIALIAALPNMGEALTETQRIFEQQMAQSAELREWWESARGGRETARLVAQLRTLSGCLGEEIVIAAAADARGRLRNPLVLAEVKGPGGERQVRDAMRQIGARETVPILVRDGVAVAGGGAETFALDGGFARTAFGARVAEAYRGGAGLLVAADFEKLEGKDPLQKHLRHVVFQQKQLGGRTDTHATVSFRGARTGPAAWLGRPAAIGALDYVSPAAGMAVAFVVDNPSRILEELIESNATAPPEARDFAASLGGEFAFALDGGILPVPAWRLAVEVYDPLRFEASLRRVVEAVNAEAARKGHNGIEVREETVGGRLYHVLSAPETAKFATAAYTFADGYLVAAPSPSMVERALENRSSGYTLGRSSEFAALLPRDSPPDFSGMFYQNLGPALGPLAELAGSLEGLSPEHRRAVQSAAGDRKPLLVTVYGEEDRIRIASGSDLLAITPAKLLSWQGPAGLASLFGGRPRGGRHRR